MEPAPICECCGSSRWQPYARKNGCEIWKCLDCASGAVQPSLSVREAAEFYGAAYYEGSSEVPGYCDYEADRPLRIKVGHSRLERILRFRQKKEPPCVLDIGCGFGEFLEIVDSSGLAIGLEVSPFAALATQRRGSRVVVASADAFPFAERFDVVTMWDVIEHLPSAGPCLREVRRVLRPDGLLVFSTPDFSSFTARLMGRSWYLLAPPTHLKFFSREGMRRLLKAYGFAQVHIESEGKRVSIRLMRHLARQFDQPLLSSVADRVLRWFPRQDLYVNLFDQITIYARPLPERDSGPRVTPSDS